MTNKYEARVVHKRLVGAEYWAVMLGEMEVETLPTPDLAERYANAYNAALSPIIKRAELADRMAEALKMLHDETEDYITRNNLGDPHHNQSMKLSREALKSYEEAER